MDSEEDSKEYGEKDDAESDRQDNKVDGEEDIELNYDNESTPGTLYSGQTRMECSTFSVLCDRYKISNRCAAVLVSSI